jgi:hypothetical protein
MALSRSRALSNIPTMVVILRPHSSTHADQERLAPAVKAGKRFFASLEKNTASAIALDQSQQRWRLKIRTSDQELYRVIFALPSIGADLKSSIVVG